MRNFQSPTAGFSGAGQGSKSSKNPWLSFRVLGHCCSSHSGCGLLFGCVAGFVEGYFCSCMKHGSRYGASFLAFDLDAHKARLSICVQITLIERTPKEVWSLISERSPAFTICKLCPPTTLGLVPLTSGFTFKHARREYGGLKTIQAVHIRNKQPGHLIYLSRRTK